MGTKVELEAGYELLVDGRASPEGAFVVLRAPAPGAATLVIAASRCVTFETRSDSYRPWWIYKESILVDGSATLKCTAADGTSIDGTVGFGRCEKSSTGMLGEID